LSPTYGYLRPDLQERINQKIENGEYENADALVQQALDWFLDIDDELSSRLQSLLPRCLVGPLKSCTFATVRAKSRDAGNSSDDFSGRTGDHNHSREHV